MLLDVVNAAFEASAGLFVLLNARTVWKHRAATGVHWIAVGFFTIWGFWNLAYYPTLGQPLSAIGGLFVCVANCIYLFSVVKFTAREPKPKPSTVYSFDLAMVRGVTACLLGLFLLCLTGWWLVELIST